MKQTILAATVAMSLGAVTLAAQKPVNYTLASSVTLTGAGIHDDGGGAYVNSSQGVEIRVFTGIGASGDLTVNLGTNRPLRTMIAETTSDSRIPWNLSFADPGPIPCWFLNVTDIWDLGRTPIGIAVLKTATFSHSKGYVAFGEYKTNGYGAYSTRVSVTRHTKGSWTVTTADTPAQAVYTVDQRGSSKPSAEYALPFTLEVVCQACESLN